MFRAHSLSLAMLSHLNSDLASILKSKCHVLSEKKSYCWRWLILAAERVFEDSNENGSIDDEVTEML